MYSDAPHLYYMYVMMIYHQYILFDMKRIYKTIYHGRNQQPCQPTKHELTLGEAILYQIEMRFEK